MYIKYINHIPCSTGETLPSEKPPAKFFHPSWTIDASSENKFKVVWLVKTQCDSMMSSHLFNSYPAFPASRMMSAVPTTSKSSMALIWSMPKCLPHAVRTSSVCPRKTRECMMCHVLRCNAPVASSATSSAIFEFFFAGTFCTFESDESSELDTDVDEDEASTSSMTSWTMAGPCSGTANEVELNCKYFQTCSGAALSNCSSWNTGSSSGFWPPLDKGVTGLQPRCTARITSVWSLSAPWTSSLLYNRVEELRDWCLPCNHLCSSDKSNCVAHEIIVDLSPCIVYELGDVPMSNGCFFHGRAMYFLKKYRPSA